MPQNIYAVVRDEFIRSIVSLTEDSPWTFRDNGGWTPITQQNSSTVIDDALLKPVPEDAVEELLEIWDESDGISDDTGAYWATEELEEYLQ